MNKLRFFLLITLSILFGLLVFAFNTSVYLTFGLSLLILGVTTFLVKENIKSIDVASIFIFLIPIAALGLFYAIGMFSNDYFSLGERIIIPFTMVVFALSGALFKCFKKDELKYMFKGLFIGIVIITIINLSLTMYHYGPFYGYKYETYYLYYNGAESRETMSSIAYVLCGFTIKNVPIQLYLIFPCLLMVLSSIQFGVSRSKKNLVVAICGFVLCLLSLILIASKIIILTSIIMAILSITISLILIFRVRAKKVLKIIGIVGFILLSLLFIFIVLNAQSNNEVFKRITTSNPILNYVFNTNRYIESINVVLNGLFSKDKFIGFPIVFDEGYALLSYPSSNILINQFMYGGIFGFVFFVLLFVIFFLNFKNEKKKMAKNDLRMYPFYFALGFIIFSLLSDVSLIDEFDITHFVFTPINPFFLVTILAGSFYVTSLKKEAK